MLLPSNGIRLYQGEAQTLVFTVADPDGFIQDLTTARLVMTVKAEASDQIPRLLKTSDSALQINIVKPLAGQVEVYITSDDTKNMDPARYVYDIWVKLDSGKIYPVVPLSILEIKPSATRFL